MKSSAGSGVSPVTRASTRAVSVTGSPRTRSTAPPRIWSTVPSWMHDYLSPYLDFELPNLGPKMQRVVSFAVRYVGYPYIWGGDWYEPTSSGYCCGFQPS